MFRRFVLFVLVVLVSAVGCSSSSNDQSTTTSTSTSSSTSTTESSVPDVDFSTVDVDADLDVLFPSLGLSPGEDPRPLPEGTVVDSEVVDVYRGLLGNVGLDADVIACVADLQAAMLADVGVDPFAAVSGDYVAQEKVTRRISQYVVDACEVDDSDFSEEGPATLFSGIYGSVLSSVTSSEGLQFISCMATTVFDETGGVTNAMFLPNMSSSQFNEIVSDAETACSESIPSLAEILSAARG